MIDQRYIKFLAVFLAFLIILPLIKYILFSAILAGIIYPLYIKLSNKLGNKIAAFISTLLLTIILVGSIYIVISNTLSEFISLSININLTHLLSNKYIQIFLPHIINILTKYASDFFQNFIKDFVGYVFSLFLTYYFLIYFPTLKQFILRSNIIRKELIDKFYGVVVGNVLLWLIQAFLSYIGFSILGVEAIILSILVFIFAALPILGPWTVWMPLVIYFAWIGNWYLAVLTFVYGILVITVLTEIVIKPLLVGKTSNINSALVLIGVFGGLYVFGFPGIFIGPLILEYVKEYFRLSSFLEEKGQDHLNNTSS